MHVAKEKEWKETQDYKTKYHEDISKKKKQNNS